MTTTLPGAGAPGAANPDAARPDADDATRAVTTANGRAARRAARRAAKRGATRGGFDQVPKPRAIAVSALLWVFIIGFGFPVLWFVLSAFKPGGELFSYPLTLFPKQWSVSGFVEAWQSFDFAPVPAFNWRLARRAELHVCARG